MPSFEIRKRRGGMVALVCEGEELMRIDAVVAEEYRLRQGVEYSDEQLEELKRLSDEARAKRSALYMLGGRDYSTNELRRKLAMKNGSAAADAAVRKMEELRLLDDDDYARSLAHKLHTVKHYAPSRIFNELRVKGIDPELARQVTDELEIDEPEEIRALLDGKLGAMMTDEKGRRRAYATLERYGYRSGNIHSVFREYDTDE